MSAIDLTIPPFLDRANLVYTYTNLHTYEDVCPHQMYRRYIVKDVPYVETPQMKFGNEVHSAFELRIAGNKPLPVAFQQWECFATPFDGLGAQCEMKVAVNDQWQPCGYWDKLVFVRGKIDITVTKGSAAYINDLKTGNSKYEDPFELELGALLLRAKHPHIESLKGTYTWLKENRISQVYDLSNFQQTWKKAVAVIEKIKRDRASGKFEKREGPLCFWCDVRDCENNRKPK